MNAVSLCPLQSAFQNGKKSYHDRKPGCIEHGKDNIGPVSNVLDGGRRDIDNDEVADPVAGSTDTAPSLSKLQR